MKKKMMKALKDFNAYIDNDREKLCDELHEIKLSHKRMERLLRETLNFFNKLYNSDFQHSVPWSEVDSLFFKIKDELSYPYHRVNWKTKGVKNV